MLWCVCDYVLFQCSMMGWSLKTSRCFDTNGQHPFYWEWYIFLLIPNTRCHIHVFCILHGSDWLKEFVVYAVQVLVKIDVWFSWRRAKTGWLCLISWVLGCRLEVIRGTWNSCVWMPVWMLVASLAVGAQKIVTIGFKSLHGQFRSVSWNGFVCFCKSQWKSCIHKSCGCISEMA